jgi:hypothetical protein
MTNYACISARGSGKLLLLNREEMGIINYRFYILPNTLLPPLIFNYSTSISVRGPSPDHNGRYQRTSCRS